MTRDLRARPVSTQDLSAYWLGELDGAQESRARRAPVRVCRVQRAAAHVVDLGAAIRSELLRGDFGFVLPAAFIRRLKDAGLRVREYELEPGGSVDCTVTRGGRSRRRAPARAAARRAAARSADPRFGRGLDARERRRVRPDGGRRDDGAERRFLADARARAAARAARRGRGRRGARDRGLHVQSPSVVAPRRCVAVRRRSRGAMLRSRSWTICIEPRRA